MAVDLPAGVKRRDLSWVLALTDLAALVGTFFLARLICYWLGCMDQSGLLDWWESRGQERLFWYLLSVTVMIFWLRIYHRHYTLRRSYWDEAREILALSIFMAMLDAAIIYLAQLPFSRLAWALNWALLFPMVLLLRWQMRSILRGFGLWLRPYVVIGKGENARETIAAISDDKWMGYCCVGMLGLGQGGDQTSFCETQNIKSETDSLGCRSDGEEEAIPCATFEGAMPFLERYPRTDIFVAVEEEEWPRIRDELDKLAICTPHMHIVPPLKGLPLLGTDVSHFFSHEVLLLRIRNNLGRRLFQNFKRVSDIIGAIVGLMLLFPFLVVIAILVRRDGAPVFFGHERIGKDGRPFNCYKFRTMLPNAQSLLEELLAKDPNVRAEWDKNFKLTNDPRVTRVGEVMRRTSIDELPQLWNVLKGDMSLVGPRPIVASELPRYVQYQAYYLQAKPGITGLWQVSGRSDTDYPTRVALDVWYVKNWSLWYDFVILMKTVKVVLNRQGAR